MLKFFIDLFSKLTHTPEGVIIGTLIGYLIGNRLKIGRDKRKEWNELIDPIRVNLFKEREHPSPYFTGLNEINIFTIREILPFWKRRCFDIAIENYRKSKTDENIVKDSLGQVSFKDTKIISHNINILLKYTKKK